MLNQKTDSVEITTQNEPEKNIELLAEHILSTDIDDIRQYSQTVSENILTENQFETGILERVNSLSTGTMGIYYKNLRTEETFEHNSIEIFPPASTFKIYTAILTLLSVEKKEFSLKNSIALSQALYVPYGSVYTRANIGTDYMISDILYNMIAGSCNTGQSMLFAKLTRDGIESRLTSELGLTSTSLKDFKTTPKEMAQTLEKLYEGDILTEEYRTLLIGLMNKSSTTDRIRAGLPKDALVANKGGTLAGSKHDVAIVSSPNGDYILAIYTKDVNETEAVNIIKEISKTVWESNSQPLI